jgi:hypothetical protein
MKRGKPLKIARPKENNFECPPPDQEIDLTKEKKTAYYSALLEAWLATRMEKDKSLLMLSAGGVGVLVTLLTTTGIQSRLVGVLFGAALTCFMVSILLAVSIFGRNADYIHCLINDKQTNELGLRRRDAWMYWSFVLGVTLSIVIGFSSGIMKFKKQEAHMSDNKPVNVNTSTPETYKKSFSGLSELAPTSNPSSDQAQQSSGSNQGSGESSQSSGNSPASGQTASK